MDKQPLISESDMITQIDIHLVGKEPDQHVIRATHRVSRTTTVREVATKSKSGICSRDEVLAPSDIRFGYHPGLPHSLFNKLPQSRDGWFDKVVTKLLGLPGSINPICRQYKSKIAIRVKTTRSLIDISGGYHIETSEYAQPSK
jgi:hypothetical protein